MKQLKITKSITNRQSDSLDKYLNEISKENLLEIDEEVELASRIKSGDKDALNRLVKANLRFVVSVAKQYQNFGLSLADLINEGNFGLLKAALRFDETKGFKFISYAVWWIRQSILQAIAENSRLVRLPQHQVGSINRIRRAFQNLEQEFEREPTAAELAEVLQIPKDKVQTSIRASLEKVSIDAPIGSTEDLNLSDILAYDDETAVEKKFASEALKREIDNALSKLSRRESQVLKMFFGVGTKAKSLKEISMIINLSPERVRQIKDRAIVRLRHTESCHTLRMYLS